MIFHLKPRPGDPDIYTREKWELKGQDAYLCATLARMDDGWLSIKGACLKTVRCLTTDARRGYLFMGRWA